MQLGALSMFCIRMCALAIRERSADLVTTGLIAEAFEGFRVDLRDGGIQALGVAYHTAVKLGADPRAIFAQAAGLANPEMAGHLREFLARRDLPEILTAMSYREAEGPDGFRYEYVRPPLPKSGRAK